LKQAVELASRQSKDPYAPVYGSQVADDLRIIEPVFNPASLAKLPLQNNTLMPCIAAMVTNVHGFGETFDYVGPEGQDKGVEAVKELRYLQQLLAQPNADETFTDLREKVGKDFETIGYAAIEVIRSLNGEIAAFYHIPAHTVRATTTDKEPHVITEYVLRDDKWEEIEVEKHFRRFVQLRDGMAIKDKTFFKEFGDDRVVSSKTGQVQDSASDEDTASEILFFSNYVPGFFYGVPKWVCQLPAILGSWESEIVNLQFFKDNGIPAMAVLVAGGALPDETVSEIRAAFNGRKGLESINRVVVIEAQSVADNSSVIEGAPPAPRLDIKPLAGERQQDGLFQEYDKNNREKIRGSMRIPANFLGLGHEYTYASAAASAMVAESQVFGPERNKFDRMVNNYLLRRDNKVPRYWRMKSNPVKLVDNDTFVKAMDGFEKSGAMSANRAIELSNSLLGTSTPRIDSPWANLPFGIITKLAEKGMVKIGDNGDIEFTEAAPPPDVTPPAPPSGKEPPNPKDPATAPPQDKKPGGKKK
jgi:PBSX family phage portal protein